MAKISLIQNIKQSQKMALTPQLLKAIKLLELNNIDLDNYLQQEVLENPLLEKASENEHPEEIIKSEISNETVAVSYFKKVIKPSEDEKKKHKEFLKKYVKNSFFN